jgi:hypothetical protein
MLHQSKLLLSAAAIAATILPLGSDAGLAQSTDPFVDHIVRVVYRWDNRGSWGFMLYTDKTRQRCFRFGDPGFRPKISDIMAVNHKVCFEPGQTTLERSPVSTSVTGIAGKKGETTIETYYSGTVRQAGNTLDMTFQPCTRLRGDPDFRCTTPAHYVVRLQDNGCDVDVTDDRSGMKVANKLCEYYPAT